MTPAGNSYSSSSHGDDLATLLVRRLEQPSRAQSWGLIKTLLVGVPSFGLIPLLAWASSFREYAAEESQSVQELAQWAKLRGRQPAAIGPLMAAAEGTTPSPLPLILALVLSALVVGVFVIDFAREEFSIDQLVTLTYLHSPSLLDASSPLPKPEFIYRVWIIALGVGYCIQWLHVRAHAADMRRFVERFNPIIAAEGLPPVYAPVRGRVLSRPLWILSALALALHGAWWGIPMVLAGMSQRRYAKFTGPLLRRELAKRVRDVVAMRQTQTVFTFHAASRCLNPRCLAAVRPHARFCARCGGAIRQEASA